MTLNTQLQRKIDDASDAVREVLQEYPADRKRILLELNREIGAASMVVQEYALIKALAPMTFREIGQMLISFLHDAGDIGWDGYEAEHMDGLRRLFWDLRNYIDMSEVDEFSGGVSFGIGLTWDADGNPVQEK